MEQFHLANGARIERISMLADTSEKGLRESASLMVNYLYDPAKIEENHEAYATDGKRKRVHDGAAAGARLGG